MDDFHLLACGMLMLRVASREHGPQRMGKKGFSSRALRDGHTASLTRAVKSAPSGAIACF